MNRCEPWLKNTRTPEAWCFSCWETKNNYGLHWSSYEIEALPQGERNQARALHLYTLVGEAATILKEVVPHRLIVWANGDLQYMDLFTEHAKDVDIFGTNVYRGESARDLFERVENESGRAVVFTEFGSDAFNAREHREDGAAQAYYLHKQWSEIYQQSRAPGVGNAIGGFIFQWSDGWWKTKQDEDLDIHNTDASWPNGGYPFDYVEGQNNMNEEWFGIAAKGPPMDACSTKYTLVQHITYSEICFGIRPMR